MRPFYNSKGALQLMPIIINTNDSPQVVIIDQNHEAFVGTQFANSDFKIEAKVLSREEYAKIASRHTRYVRGMAREDTPAISMEVFIKAVISWQGICDQDGKPMDCDEKNKRLIANKYWLFASNVSGAIIDAQENSMVAREQEVKN
jgi:hypothetical protein